MKIWLISLLLILFGAAATGGAWYYEHQKTLQLQNQLITATADSQKALEDMSNAKAEDERMIEDLHASLSSTTAERDELQSQLDAVTQKYNDVFDKVDSALTTVGRLDKLSKLDPELLKKYSKVYFLNENYRPARLNAIDNDYVYTDGKKEQLLSQVMPFFEDMVRDAKNEGVDLYVVSAYRSFDEQKSLKNAYTTNYGSGANAFSADQGYSEHQLGTTIDFTTKGINGGLSGFDATPAYAWLQKNAYKYGFELSYPKGNQYYIYEPWHWRFVGVKLARMLHNEDKNFYDVDQRDIDRYLITIFD